MKDHRGVSLVELIVVLAIMGVLAGAGVSLFGTLTGAKLNEASDKITAALGRTRTEALSRSDAEFTLYQNANGKYYVDIYYSGNTGGTTITEEVGASQLSMSYSNSDGTTTVISGTNQLKIQFDRSTGAIKSAYESNGSSIYTKNIVISAGTRTKTITLYTLTGKYSVQ